MPQRTYAILGTGALGGFYGARLQRAGLEVHFLLHSDFEHVRRHGLKVESKDGDFELPRVKAYGHVRDMPPCDVAIVALKATQNHLLPDLLPPVMKKDGVALIMQNGIGAEDEAARAVGPDRVMGGLCFLCSNKVGPGHIRHLDYGSVTLADHSAENEPCGITPRMKEIGEDFQRAGLPVELVEDLVLARWKKLVWNIPFSGLSVVLNALTDELMADPQTRELSVELMLEVVAGAAGSERVIPASFLEKMIADTDKMPPYRTSMHIDFEQKRPMEVEAIFGNPLRIANNAGIEVPRIEMLYQQLKFLDQRNKAPHWAPKT
ncbi:MAG: putative 2-dehydropantoate 2-reductase [Verrucomicrobiota bacterium]